MYVRFSQSIKVLFLGGRPLSHVSTAQNLLRKSWVHLNKPLCYIRKWGGGKKDRIYAATVNHGLRRRRSKAILLLLPLRICQEQKATKKAEKGGCGEKRGKFPPIHSSRSPLCQKYFSSRRRKRCRYAGRREGDLCSPNRGPSTLFFFEAGVYLCLPYFQHDFALHLSSPPSTPRQKRGEENLLEERIRGKEGGGAFNKKVFSLSPEKKFRGVGPPFYNFHTSHALNAHVPNCIV